MKKWVLILIIVIVMIGLMVSFAYSALHSDMFLFRIPRNMIQNLFSKDTSSSFGFTKSFDINDTFSDSINGIKKIEVSSVSSEITVFITEEPDVTVKLYGTYRTNREKSVKLIMNRSGSTLTFKVDYPKTFGFNINTSSDLQLDVYLPKSYVDELSLSTVSGDIRAKELFNQKNRFETVSGDVVIDKLLFTEVWANTVSGDINFTVESADSQTLLDLESVSGRVYLDYLTKIGDGKAQEQVRIETVSGEVDIKLPKDSAFKFRFNSTSGKLKSDFPMALESSGRSSSTGTVNNGNSIFRATKILRY